ncbi:hypothetical protein KBA73_03250 [Patescibacteria group bacterium]|nr:hypothetical protein [Patescibacteria group bacterium]
MEHSIIDPLTDTLGRCLLEVGAMRICDVGAGEAPFPYTSGNVGPLFVNVKGLVSHTLLRDSLVSRLAVIMCNASIDVDFVAANVAGGVPFGLLLHQELSRRLGRDIPFIYIRPETQKHGLRERVVGVNVSIPALQPGKKGIVIEELVNFASTTINSVRLLRSMGYEVESAGCLLDYAHPASQAALAEAEIKTLFKLFTIEQLITLAEEQDRFSPDAIRDAREYLKDADAWMKKYGFVKTHSK